MPLEFQAPLLRVLQEKEIRRVGDDTVIPVDIRIIGATNRDLLQMVEAGKFRQDLYYRLNVLSIKVPPLRDRGEDYLEIARSIYDRVSPQRTAQEEADFFRVMAHASAYPWPGNVRELTNLVERISLLLRCGTCLLYTSIMINIVSACTDWESAGISAVSCGDNVKAGENEMQHVADLLDGKGNIAILTGPSSTTDTTARLEGYRNILANYRCV